MHKRGVSKPVLMAGRKPIRNNIGTEARWWDALSEVRVMAEYQESVMGDIYRF